MLDESSLDSLEKLLTETFSKYHKAQARQFSSIGLTSQQAAILVLLERMGPTKVGDIAILLKMVCSNASNICTRLEKLGLTERHRPPGNQRVVEIRLTDKAIEKMAAIQSSIHSMHAQMLNGIAQKDVDDIRRGLEKFNQLLDRCL